MDLGSEPQATLDAYNITDPKESNLRSQLLTRPPTG